MAGHFYPEEEEFVCDSSLECPEPEPDVSFQGEVENYIEVDELKDELGIEENNNNIQSTGRDIGYRESGSRVTVSDIDMVNSVSGKSMQPRFFTDHTLLYREVDSPEELEEGDVVRFYVEDEGYYVHTIEGMYLENGFAYTRGDNNPDGEVTDFEDISHVVVGVLYTDK